MSEEKKKSPTLDLRGADGNYVIADILGRYSREVSRLVKGKNKKWVEKSVLFKVYDTNGSTILWTKENGNKEVSIAEGDAVFMKESTFITKALDRHKIGDKIKLTYTGLGEAKPGKSPAYEYEIEGVK